MPLQPNCVGTEYMYACCRWLKIEQHKLQKIDTSWADALAAAKESGASDVVYKLEALIGVVLPTLGVTGATLPAAAAAASSSDSGSAELGAVAAITQNFQPDLALKQELHDIKVTNAVKVCRLSQSTVVPVNAQ
jgi:hypothetical protein